MNETQAAGTSGTTAFNKSWDELTVEEKLERTRIMVRDLINQMRRLRVSTEVLERHHHDPNTGEPSIKWSQRPRAIDLGESSLERSDWF